jgi:hypothetical protein
VTLRRLLLIVVGLLAGLPGCGGPVDSPATKSSSTTGISSPSAGAAASTDAAASPTPESAAAELGMPASFSNEWGMRFVLVPGGTYFDGDGKPGDHAARHETQLWRAFYLQDGKVTRGQWARCFGGAPTGDEADAPVERVSYPDAERFAAWLSEHDKRWTYRLPTEAEWDRAWLSGRPVADAAPTTPWGLRGMSSPPAEWCFDWYEDFPDWPVMSPRGPELGTERVLRPGPPEHLAGRRSLDPDRRDPGVGLRVAVSLGYGGDDRGKYRITFHTRGGLPTQPDGDEMSGYQIRVVSIVDRLGDRQIGRHYSWEVLPGTSSPLSAKLVPGVYYAQCQRLEDGVLRRGMEVKFGATQDAVEVDLPIPQPGGYYQEPE